MATRVVSRIRAVLGVELGVRAVFESPTVEGLSGRPRGEKIERPALERQARPERIPLSYAQQRLWFIDRLEGASTEYNMPEAVRLRGKLDRKALRRAVETIVERHESLRGGVGGVEGGAG